jgi:hypothetical protein
MIPVSICMRFSTKTLLNSSTIVSVTEGALCRQFVQLLLMLLLVLTGEMSLSDNEVLELQEIEKPRNGGVHAGG